MQNNTIMTGILTIKEEYLMYKRILVAVDGSENSKRAAEQAVKIKTLSQETLIEVLYVLDHDRIRGDFSKNLTEINLPIEQETRLAPIKGVFEKKRINYELFIKHGEPGATIVSFANRGGFDLVIIGSRGHNALQEMMLGSVSKKVAKQVKAPIMIVK